MSIEYRLAIEDDSRSIAEFICIAGGGLYEFLFDDLIPFVRAVDFLAAGVAGETYPISYTNCLVAVDEEKGSVVGAANVFPADLLKDENYALLPFDRGEHIGPMLEHQDWGSMFLNALAVSDACRGAGVGSRLMDWAERRAREAGFDRLSLHVWADNIRARALYTSRGYVDLGIANVAPHPRLPHTGGSVLMRKMLPA